MMATFVVAVVLTLGGLAALVSPWPFLAPFVVAGVFGLAILYRRPAWGLLGLAMLIPFEGLFKNTEFTGIKLLGGGLLGILLIQLVLSRIPLQRLAGRIWVFIYLFILCAVLSTMYSESLPMSLGYIRELLIGMTFFVMTLLIGHNINPRLLYYIVGVSVTATAVFALISTNYQVGGRAIGLLQDANYFALLIAIAIPAALLGLLSTKQWYTRVFWLAAMLLLFSGMTKTDSRSGLLVVVCCLLIAGWHHRAKLAAIYPRHLGFLVLGSLVVIPLGIKSVPVDYIDRIKSLSVIKGGVNPYQDASLGRRASYLLVGKDMVMENPMVGVGPGTFPLRYARSSYAKAFSATLVEPDLYRRAHNTYLEIFSEMGIPAGLFFIAIVLLGLYNFYLARNMFLARQDSSNADLAAHLGLGLLSLAVFLLFLSTPNHKYLWMFLALSVVVRQQAQELLADWEAAE